MQAPFSPYCNNKKNPFHLNSIFCNPIKLSKTKSQEAGEIFHFRQVFILENTPFKYMYPFRWEHPNFPFKTGLCSYCFDEF